MSKIQYNEIEEIKSAMQIISEMKARWNLVNSLESHINELNWGNPLTTQDRIYTIINKRFKTKEYQLDGMIIT